MQKMRLNSWRPVCNQFCNRALLVVVVVIMEVVVVVVMIVEVVVVMVVEVVVVESYGQILQNSAWQ